MKCEDCKWWQDYNCRVMARISESWGNIHRGLLELRLCKFNPAPSVDTFTQVYTDKEYICSNFIRKNE